MESQKHLFSLDDNVHYLNCAYKGPLLKKGEEACKTALVRDRNPFKLEVSDYFEPTEKVRALFSQLISCDAQSVAIIPSTSYGFASAMRGVIPKPGGKALVVGEEFPSAYFTVEHWCKTNNNELHIIKAPASTETPGNDWNNAILAAIDNSVTVIVISSVHWMSGLTFDLMAIGEQCKAHDVRFLVDGTQSVGIAPINVKACNIDALICAGYKWLLGPYSMGLAYIGERLVHGTPLEQTWMNRTNARAFTTLTEYEKTYRAGAGKFNVGETSNFVLTPILIEGLQQISEWGVQHMQEYCRRITKPLFDFLEEQELLAMERNFCSAHLFSLRTRKGVKPDKMKQMLTAEHIIVSVRGANLRVSVNVFNDTNDIEALIDTLRRK